MTRALPQSGWLTILKLTCCLCGTNLSRVDEPGVTMMVRLTHPEMELEIWERFELSLGQGRALSSSLVSVGLADYSQVGRLDLRCEFVNSGVENSPGSSDW